MRYRETALRYPRARATGVRVVWASFPWDDLGSWLALARLPSPGADAAGNVVVGPAVTLQSNGCIVDTSSTSGRLVVLFGAQDLVVVDTGDTVLVTPKSRAADLKTLVGHLKALGHYPA